MFVTAVYNRSNAYVENIVSLQMEALTIDFRQAGSMCVERWKWKHSGMFSSLLSLDRRNLLTVCDMTCSF